MRDPEVDPSTGLPMGADATRFVDLTHGAAAITTAALIAVSTRRAAQQNLAAHEGEPSDHAEQMRADYQRVLHDPMGAWYGRDNDGSLFEPAAGWSLEQPFAPSNDPLATLRMARELLDLAEVSARPVTVDETAPSDVALIRELWACVDRADPEHLSTLYRVADQLHTRLLGDQLVPVSVNFPDDTAETPTQTAGQDVGASPATVRRFFTTTVGGVHGDQLDADVLTRIQDTLSALQTGRIELPGTTQHVRISQADFCPDTGALTTLHIDPAVPDRPALDGNRSGTT